MSEFIFWTIIVLGTLNSGYMLFDGLRAFITGDYIRPKTGDYAGKLGPWEKVVTTIGIQPLSPLMKCIFVLYGVTGLVIITSFALHFTWGWTALLIYNISALWYLIAGTASSVIQIGLLLVLYYLA